MIELKNVSVIYPDKTVLRDFSAVFPDKGLFLITGASGSGKTTLVRLILGLISPTKGNVLTKSTKIATVFQEDRLVPTLTALENVKLVSSRQEAIRRLTDVGLGDSLKLFLSELSGGMKRRVAIARALAYGGDILILDEAFTGIDEPTAKDILAKIMAEYKDKLVIAVTHMPELFSQYNPTEINIPALK